MMKRFILFAVISFFLLTSVSAVSAGATRPAADPNNVEENIAQPEVSEPQAAPAEQVAVETVEEPTVDPADEIPAEISGAANTPYTIGIDDILEITVIQPDKISNTVTVSPDGTISFPYIGSVRVKELTLAQVQEEIQARLADGFMKYPVVYVSLVQSRSRKFFVYGEVMKPGTHILENNTTILRAISMAGGFTKYGSSSRVKMLRPKKNGPGYDTIKVNIKAVMDGNAGADKLLEPGDIIVVSEGVF